MSTPKVWQPGMTMAEVYDRAMREALEHYGGNRTKAAEALGLTLRTVRRHANEITVGKRALKQVCIMRKGRS